MSRLHPPAALLAAGLALGVSAAPANAAFGPPPAIPASCTLTPADGSPTTFSATITPKVSAGDADGNVLEGDTLGYGVTGSSITFGPSTVAAIAALGGDVSASGDLDLAVTNAVPPNGADVAAYTQPAPVAFGSITAGTETYTTGFVSNPGRALASAALEPVGYAFADLTLSLVDRSTALYDAVGKVVCTPAGGAATALGTVPVTARSPQPPPTVLARNEGLSPLAGGGTVRLYGTFDGPVKTVVFGETPTVFKKTSYRTLDVTVPRSDVAGITSITVTTAAGGSSSGDFLYYDPADPLTRVVDAVNTCPIDGGGGLSGPQTIRSRTVYQLLAPAKAGEPLVPTVYTDLYPASFFPGLRAARSSFTLSASPVASTGTTTTTGTAGDQTTFSSLTGAPGTVAVWTGGLAEPGTVLGSPATEVTLTRGSLALSASYSGADWFGLTTLASGGWICPPAATVSFPIAGSSTPTPTPTPGPKTVAYSYALSGSATLKTLTKGTLPLTGTADAELTLSTRAVSADLTLAPTAGNLVALGFLPVRAKVTLVPQGPAVGSLEDAGLAVTAKVRIKLPSVTLFGLQLAGGSACQAKSITSIALRSPGEFSPLDGGTLAGTFSISDLTGCGGLTGLVSPLTKGGGNAIALKLTPKR